MKRTILAMTAGLLVAGAAVAQPYPPRAPWDAGAFWRGAPDSPRERIQFLQDRVNRGLADGSLNRREAMRVNRELNGVRQWIRRMHWEDAGRLTPDQRARVQDRLDQISRQIRWLRHNGW
ncbi:hypothetical protein [Sphingomonas sp. MMS24-J13]|uniref:hypothetical protein n=1 Tax=Sphingomonas sp. MMS24-J13 TaxID=3238686 RepID=UPI00384A81A6